MAILTGMVAGAMVFSSFAAPKQDIKGNTSEIIINDNGWEDWAKVAVQGYYQNENTNGQWRQGHYGATDCQVQRREWCGEKEFRIRFGREWYPVSESPVKGYRYCFYYLNEVMCFNM